MKNDSPDLPHVPLVCWAVRHGHVALLRSLEHNTPHTMNEYFIQAATWFGSKNREYVNGNNKQIVPVSDILLPHLKSMTHNAGVDTLFYFIYQACIRGDISIVDLYISAMGQHGHDTQPQNYISISQLSYEYFMIEAAIHGKASVCRILLPYCDFRAFTL